MSDNTTLPGTGDIVRDLDRSGVKTQVMALDVGGLGGEKVLSGTNPMPVTDSQIAQDNAWAGLDVLSSPQPRNGNENVTLVAMHPDFPLTLDPQQVMTVGGRTKDGFTMPTMADSGGAQMLSDAPDMITGQAFAATGKAAVLLNIDTKGYQSLAVQVFGTWAGTITFYASNNGQDWFTVAGWNIGSGQTPASNTTANTLMVFPCSARYFRALVTTYTSGTALAVAFLRNIPLPILQSNPSVNLSQYGGAAMVSAGASGVVAVGGYHGVGVVPAVQPVGVSGTDLAGKVRRIMTDILGNTAVVGGAPDPAANPVRVQTVQSNNAEDGITDVLGQILRELKYHSFVLQQLPLFLNQGLSQVDEAQVFRDDPTLQLN